jgi:hypothetical protein
MTGKPHEKVRLKVDVEDLHLAPESLWFAPFVDSDRAAYESLLHLGWPPEVADQAVRHLRQKYADSRSHRAPLRAGEVVEVALVFPHFDGEPEAENGLLVENDKGARGVVSRGGTEPAPPGESTNAPGWEGHYA